MTSQAHAVPQSEHPDTAIKRRILIVDDDHAIVRVFANTLKTANYEVVCANDGTQATTLLDAGAFDVIISDISMPGMSGIEFLQAVRRRDLDVPVVLVTGEPDIDSAVRAVEYGALRYLEKPVSPDSLRDVVRRAGAISRARAH